MTMNRRDFVRTVAGATLALPACAGAGAGAAQSRQLRRVGIQLYSVRDDARRDLERTLGALGDAGYDDVEMLGSMNNFGVAPAQVRAMLDRAGLRAPSSHVSAALFDQLDRQLDDALTLGHTYLIVAGLPAERTRTLDDWRGWADRFNVSGALARRRGVWLGFHNHAGDLRPIDGVVPYDGFIERTDAAVVRHQLDTGNLAMANRDPMDYVRRFGSRYWSFHIKDVPRLGATSDAELGTGVLDFPRLLAMIDRIDEKHLFVEQETYPGTPLESARRNHRFISSVKF